MVYDRGALNRASHELPARRGRQQAIAGLALASIALLLSGLFAAPATRAEPSATLNQFRAASSPSDGFALERPDPRGHLSMGARLQLDYADDPLVFEQLAGQSDSEGARLVSDQLTAHTSLSIGLYEALMLQATLPLHLWMDGQNVGSLPGSSGTGSGDLQFGARYRLARFGPASVGAQINLGLPTGESGEGRPGVAGESGVSGEGELLSDLTIGRRLRLMLNLGLRFRPDTRFGGLRFGDLATAGAGAELSLLDQLLSGHIELYGSTPLTDFGNREGSPLEALLGLRLSPGQELNVGIAGGMGLLRGYGSPDLRMIATVGYQSAGVALLPAEERGPTRPRRREPESPKVSFRPVKPAGKSGPDTAMLDADGDGVSDLEDRCPATPGDARNRGCATHIVYHADSGTIELRRQIGFEAPGDRLEARSADVLTEVSALLRANPELHVRIEAHVLQTNTTTDAQRMAQSLQRALAVGRRLYELDTGGARLEAYGCGSTRPIAPKTGSRRFKNERIEFFVVSPEPKEGARQSPRCVEGQLPARTPRPAPQAPKPPPASARPRPALAPTGPQRSAPPGAEASAEPAPKPTAKATASQAAPATAAGAWPAIAASTTSAALASSLVAEPRADRDGDGLTNASDSCPLAVGPRDTHGCPKSHRVDLEKGRIELKRRLLFEAGTAKLTRRSGKHLDELAATLKANPKIKLIVSAHLADDGDPAASMALSLERARAVVDALAQRGVTQKRLLTYGCGDSRPVAPNNVPWGRKQNERIDLLLLDPSPPVDVQSLSGCSSRK